MSRPWNEHGEPQRLIQKTQLSFIMWDASTLWQAPPQRRWIIWTERSRMDSDSASGWRTIRIGIPYVASRDSKRYCESFNNVARSKSRYKEFNWARISGSRTSAQVPSNSSARTFLL